MLSTPIEKYQKTIIEDKIIKNQTLKNLYNKLYNPDPEPKLIINNMEKAKDEKQKFELIENNIINNNKYPSTTKYNMHFIHPCKKVFMGPDKLNVIDKYNIIFENKKLMYIEISDYLSGFPLIDTFFTRILYIYQQCGNDIKLTIKVYIEFVKPCLMKSLIEKNGYNQIEEGINNITLHEIDNLLAIKETKNIIVNSEKKDLLSFDKLFEPFIALERITNKYEIMLDW